MGLKSDFDEVLEAWPKYPWILRFWLIISAFTASGAIASLSETVFKWKGFLLDAVVFYRSFLSKPLAQCIHVQNPHIGPAMADALLLATVSSLAQVVVSVEQNEPPSLRLRREFQLAFLLVVFLSIGGMIERPALSLESLLVWWWLGILGWQLIQYIRLRGSTRLLGLSSLLFPFVLLGIAAAINAGLSRVAA